MTAVATAPGKVVLCGEYAVLDGAPAICMAVNRRARAEVRISDSSFDTVRTRGYADGDWTYRASNDGCLEPIGREWPDGGLDLLRAVRHTMGIDGIFDIGLDTSEFVDPLRKQKLGLGSSAALTVALVTAFENATNCAGDAATHAAEAHGRFQRGRGSGVDVATSLAGGVVEYRLQDLGLCRPISWPAGLEYALLWSRKPASTADKLKIFDESRRSGRGGPGLRELCAASESTARCWSAGDAPPLLAAFHQYVDALMQFDVDHDLGIFDAGHRELAESAEKSGLVYKPCGAGGGDTGIVFATDKRAIAEFAKHASESGHKLLDATLENAGVILES